MLAITSAMGARRGARSSASRLAAVLRRFGKGAGTVITTESEIVVMRAGLVVQDGDPHTLLTQPCDDYVAKLMETPKRQADRLEELVEAGPAEGAG